MKNKTIKLNISGMTCVNCSNAVEKVTKKIDGVKEAKVSFASSFGEFIVDEKLDESLLVSKIKKLGYDVAYSESELEDKKLDEFKILKRRLFVAVFCAILIMIFEKVGSSEISRWSMFICASIVQFYCGFYFYKHAFGSLKAKNYDMNVLVSLGTSVAYLYSFISLINPGFFPEKFDYLYFGGSSMIITFILFGKFLEEKSKAKATDYLKKLMDLSPDKAIKIVDSTEIEVRTSELNINDIIVVKPGSRIPADGVVIEGKSEIDTSMLTGEAFPVLKQKDDEVSAGVLNLRGLLKVKVTKLQKDTMLCGIIELLKVARSKKCQ